MGEGGTEGRSRKNRGGGKADRPLVNLHGKCIKDWLSPPPPPSVSTLFLSSPFLCLSQLFSAKVHVGGWGSRGFAVQVGWAWAAREQQQLVEGERYGGSVKGARYGRN